MSFVPQVAQPPTGTGERDAAGGVGVGTVSTEDRTSCSAITGGEAAEPSGVKSTRRTGTFASSRPGGQARVTFRVQKGTHPDELCEGVLSCGNSFHGTLPTGASDCSAQCHLPPAKTVGAGAFSLHPCVASTWFVWVPSSAAGRTVSPMAA